MKISLIVPTLNAGKYIEQLLQRLKDQTVPIDEIVVIDSAIGFKPIRIRIKVEQYAIFKAA